MSRPDPSTILDTAANHASSHAHLPDLSDLIPTSVGPSQANAHMSDPSDLVLPTQSHAEGHAGEGIETATSHIDTALTHTDVTLPELSSLTRHDFFWHG